MEAKLLCISVTGALMALAGRPAVAQGAGTDTAKDHGLIEIVVTAQRFTESVQRTSLAIEVLDADKLQGVTEVRQISALAPGVSVAPAGNVMQTYVRGVGSGNATNQQESAVSYNADGVFLATTTMISPMMYDLQRVEVLKGPQGTLYGRNSSGGALNIITKGASTDMLEGYFEAEAGNYDLYRVTGAVNIPLGKTFALRLAGQDTAHDGYLSDGTDDLDQTAGRVRLLWAPSANVKLTGGVDVARIDAIGAGSSLDPEHNPTGDDRIGAIDLRLQNGVAVPIIPPFPPSLTACGPGTFNPNGTQLFSCDADPPPSYAVEQTAAFAQLDVDFGFATLTVLPALRDEDLDSITYVPGYTYAEINDTEQKTLEARLSNQSDALRWVLGAYYYDNQQTITNVLSNPVFFQGNEVHFDSEIESYAAFGEATFSLTDSFRLIAGARYTKEEATQIGRVNSDIAPPGVPGSPSSAAYNPFFLSATAVNPTGEFFDYPIDTYIDGDATTWKGGFEFDAADDSMLFLTVSRGFKGGGSYVDLPIADARFKPEFLTAYELGSRNRFVDGTLQLNAELFYWELEDQQIPYVGFNSAGSVSFITANAGEATMYGANVDVTWQPSPADTLHLGVEYLDAEYDSFVRTVPSLAVTPGTRCEVGPTYDPTPGSQVVTTIDCSGLPMQKSAEWTGSAGYQHLFEFGDFGDIVFSADVTYASERYTSISYTDEVLDGAYALWNSSLTYISPKGTVSVSGWVRNISDERVVIAGSQINTAYSRDLLMAPRTAGVSIRYSF